MRILPASSYKTKKSKGGVAAPPLTKDGMPELGSLRRQMFDYFRDRKGMPILNEELKKFDKGIKGRVLADLIDYYGLDIRSVPDCHHKTLCGEWFGDKYVDYIAEKLDH